MSHFIAKDTYEIRTDLAIEAHDLALKKAKGSLKGVEIKESKEKGITTSWMHIKDEESAKKIGKSLGTYLTLHVPKLRSKDSSVSLQVAVKFAQEFKKFLDYMKVKDDSPILVVGLGNPYVTPDSLGPLVVKNIIVTRHLFHLSKDYKDYVSKDYRPVSAFQPGVLGITGIETSDIVKGVIEKTEPDLCIVIDALASRSLDRLNTTIQVSNAGISPGSGIGNKRRALNKEFLGLPVIAIGVPTVVDAITISHDVIDFVLSYLSCKIAKKEPNPLDPFKRLDLKDLNSKEVPKEVKDKIFGAFGKLTSEEKRQLIKEVLTPLGQNLVVTPKDVDAFIIYISKIISNGLNCALHKAVNMDNVASHL